VRKLSRWFDIYAWTTKLAEATERLVQRLERLSISNVTVLCVMDKEKWDDLTREQRKLIIRIVTGEHMWSSNYDWDELSELLKGAIIKMWEGES
jgi:TRAP-type C4-dicarboxylate transport system substrate-binding protein